ncbi:MAG: anti-sigma factor [Desulfobacterales bacterium]|jgi:predicted anti-sigma-YlaC factor YlaD
MKKPSRNCDPVMVSSFLDKELDPADDASIDRHINSCPSCKKMLDDLKALSRQVRTHITGICDTDHASIEKSLLETICRKKTLFGERVKEAVLSKKVWIPATAVASLLLIFFTVFQSPGVTEPSAIIASLSGDVSSVVIIETSRTRQTILWFNEEFNLKD